MGKADKAKPGADKPKPEETPPVELPAEEPAADTPAAAEAPQNMLAGLLANLTKVAEVVTTVRSPEDWTELPYEAGKGEYVRFRTFPVDTKEKHWLYRSYRVRRYVKKETVPADPNFPEGEKVERIIDQRKEISFSECEEWLATDASECNKEGGGVMLSQGQYRFNRDGRWVPTRRGGYANSAAGAKVYFGFPGAIPACEAVGITPEMLQDQLDQLQHNADTRRRQGTQRTQQGQQPTGPQTPVAQQTSYSGPAGDEGSLDVPDVPA
jgi:hypothetical protein